MRWPEKPQKEWRRVFALLPLVTIDGQRVWLEYVEKRSTYIGSSWFEDHYNDEYRVIE